MTTFEVVSSDVDPFDVRRVRAAPGALREFNDAGVLNAADIHVALRLGRLGAEGDPEVLLAVALAVRAPRLGHVCTDLATISETVTTDVEVPVDLRALPWPDPDEWIVRLSASPLVAVGEDAASGRPLRLVGRTMYLDRYWREERQVAADLRARGDAGAEGVDTGLLATGLVRLFGASAGAVEVLGGEPDYQRLAAASAVLRRFAVVAGGPGTGKTTTVARILALLDEQATAAGRQPPRVALAAPTGKAAARLEEAVHEEAAGLDVSEETRARLLAAGASTLHRLLGWRPDSRSRYRHNRRNRLPHDVVVVDETSMVSLSLMAKLVEAIRPDARLVLVGDPEQLASVEAGAVLGDIVGPAADGLLIRAPARLRLAEAAREDVPATDPPGDATVGDGIVVLRHVHRFGGGIAALAQAARRGDADAVMAVLGEGRDDVRWVPVDIGLANGAKALSPVRTAVVAAGRRVYEAATSGDARGALDALGSFRVLCAHRRGPYGAATWMARVEEWLAAGIEGFATAGVWYPGRPLLVTENDYGLRLYNGDTGIVVASPAGAGGAAGWGGAGGTGAGGGCAGGGGAGGGGAGGGGAGGGGAAGPPMAAFQRGVELLQFSPTRLAAVDTVYAMTVHKSQGSQFDGVAVLLPDPASPILTRELLYTAITRARQRLILVGTEAAVRAAVTRPIARASGLRRWLWDDQG